MIIPITSTIFIKNNELEGAEPQNIKYIIISSDRVSVF